ncbi:hypothetical protein LTR08_004236 [Meristemomyces frigidus]|nr:hypothetical protein LTR08_004236 [Meristemomyces frigidus]
MLFRANSPEDVTYNDDHVLQNSEHHFQEARSKLSAEKGRPRLESLQARLAVCLYLLHTGRPNQAWYGFGTLVQMMFVLGLHQPRTTDVCGDLILRECQKRTFWAIATLDIYLSVMLGRPPLIHEEDINQQYPQQLDDDELSSGGTAGHENKDRLVSASVLHAQIARVVRKAVRAQSAGTDKVDSASAFNQELSSWQASLPVILSGAVHPSSLVAGFRRQITVLRLAHSHAAMLINRPLLLLDTAPSSVVELHINTCLTAANVILDMLTGSGSDGAPLGAFWFTQYVAFNAVSIVYVWLIQRKRGRLSSVNAFFQDLLLMHKADAVQKQFAAATKTNAPPSLRYNIVLEELQQEIHALDGVPWPQHTSAIVPELQLSNMARQDPTTCEPGVLFEPTPLDMEFNAMDPDLWLQLDSFPFSNFGLEQWASPS